MAKERITTYLERDVYDKARSLLNEKGFSVSQYIELVLKEYIQVTEGQPMHKRLEEMTLPEFLDLAKYWINEMKEEKPGFQYSVADVEKKVPDYEKLRS